MLNVLPAPHSPDLRSVVSSDIMNYVAAQCEALSDRRMSSLHHSYHTSRYPSVHPGEVLVFTFILYTLYTRYIQCIFYFLYY